MKKLLLGLLLSVGVVTTSQAGSWFSVNANVIVNQNFIQANVVNSMGRPIYCKGYVYGKTQYGQRLTKSIKGWVPAGGGANPYLYTTGNAYFVKGWANIKCRF